MGAAIPLKPRCKRNCDGQVDARVAVIFAALNFCARVLLLHMRTAPPVLPFRFRNGSINFQADTAAEFCNGGDGCGGEAPAFVSHVFRGLL